MTELVELSSSKHGKLKVVENCAVAFAAKQHLMHLRVTEVGKAVSSLPVFFTRNAFSGSWVMSAMCGFQQGHNLFVKNDQWTATYLPTAMQTHPLYLMQSPKDANSFTVGIDEKSNSFSEEQGEALFDENESATPYLRRVTALLEQEIKNDMQTYRFAQKLEELGLIKSINIQLYFKGDTVQTLQGLHTLDEDHLHSLGAEQLEELNKAGYLLPIHAMLVSIFQLNALIRKHNKVKQFNTLKQIKLEVTKDPARQSTQA